VSYDAVGNAMFINEIWNNADAVRRDGQNLKLSTELTLYLNEMRHVLHARPSRTAPCFNQNPLAAKLLQTVFVLRYVPAIEPAEILGSVTDIDRHQ
jgi:hypothetical protein